MNKIKGFEVKTEYKTDQKKSKFEKFIAPLACAAGISLLSLISTYTGISNTSLVSEYNGTKEVKIYGAEGLKKALDENIPLRMRNETGLYSELLKLNPDLTEKVIGSSTATITLPVYSEEKK